MDDCLFNVGLLIIGLVCALIVSVKFNNERVSDESYCYQFYKENGFVLDSCEEYKEKFESLGEK